MLAPSPVGSIILVLATLSAAGCQGTEPTGPIEPVERLSPEEHDTRGHADLKAGRFEDAIAHFNSSLAAHPQDEPHHWPRGIAYYYAGEYAKGVRQFELHRTVNPADVENAVWHFLCKAKLDGIPAAQDAILPVGQDRRVPMMTVYEMFAGRSTPDDVLQEAESTGMPEHQAESARFYAHLYVGLYHEILGEADRARHHITMAAQTHTSTHYMGDLARMHAGMLGRGVRSER